MGLEVISQVLTSTNATYVNGVSAQRKFSEATLKNLYQGLVEKDGRGVNDKFVSETDANEYSQIFVNRILPVKMKAREQGANKNGASYSQNSHYVQTTTVGIDILQIIDDTVRIPRARQDWIKVDLLAEQIKIYSDRLATIINGATAAEKLLAAWSADEYNHYEFTAPASITGKEILNEFIFANSLLDEGDPENGIDMFPEDTRIAVFKTTWRAYLKTSGVLQLGGANFAYDILKGGAISEGAKARKVEDGYIGELDGVPCHLLSNESLGHASEFLGFDHNDLKASPFVGYISSSYANARGVSTVKETKVVDDPAGQGVILQPLTKFGVKAFYPKGNVILCEGKSSAWNPIAALKTLFAGITGIVFKLKGAGSRLVANIPATGWTLGTTAFTLTGAEALDDFNVDHVKGSYFYVGTAKATDLADFLAKASAATYKGQFTIGTSKSTTIADGEFVNVCLIADDGTITLGAAKYEA